MPEEKNTHKLLEKSLTIRYYMGNLTDQQLNFLASSHNLDKDKILETVERMRELDRTNPGPVYGCFVIVLFVVLSRLFFGWLIGG